MFPAGNDFNGFAGPDDGQFGGAGGNNQPPDWIFGAAAAEDGLAAAEDAGFGSGAELDDDQSVLAVGLHFIEGMKGM